MAQPPLSPDFETQVLQRLTQIEQDLEKLDYKFDTYQKASDALVRLTTTIIVAAATVAVLPSALEAIGPVIQTFLQGLNP